MNTYEHKALLWAEKYGIAEYEVVGNEMRYSLKYPLEYTRYHVTINLDTLEEKRIGEPLNIDRNIWEKL